jgi:hypothetical protein
MKIEGSGSESGSISQRHGSADPDPDPDPHQNVMDPQHCHKVRTDKEYHGVSPLCRNWDSPTPLFSKRVCPPPPGTWGGGGILACE